MRESGRDTPLDTRPELDDAGLDLWQAFCFTGEDIMSSLDIYADRIGLPADWEFEDCCRAILAMRKKSSDLKVKPNDG